MWAPKVGLYLQVCSNYNMKVYTEDKKFGFCGKVPFPNSNSIEYVSRFRYLLTWITILIIRWPSFNQYVAQFVKRYRGKQEKRIKLFRSETCVSVEKYLSTTEASEKDSYDLLRATHDRIVNNKERYLDHLNRMPGGRLLMKVWQ